MRWAADVRAWWRRLFPEESLGRKGEAAAARFLRRSGYRILARGDALLGGEIDLVALDGRAVVFVEVKTRRAAEAGHPAEAVDADKQRRLTRVAVLWLRRHHMLDRPARFDVVAVTWPEDARKPRIEHFRNAFEASGLDQFYG